MYDEPNPLDPNLDSLFKKAAKNKLKADALNAGVVSEQPVNQNVLELQVRLETARKNEQSLIERVNTRA